MGLVVSGVLLIALYRRIDFQLIGQALLGADRMWLATSIGMIVPITVLRGLRFFWVAPAGTLPGVGEALRLTVVASALNAFMPAKSGDLIKSYRVAKSGSTSTGVAIAIIVYERLCDLFGLLSWCLLGWLIGRPQVPSLPSVFWLLLGALAAVCGAMILSRRVASVVAQAAHTGMGRPRESIAASARARSSATSSATESWRTETSLVSASASLTTTATTGTRPRYDWSSARTGHTLDVETDGISGPNRPGVDRLLLKSLDRVFRDLDPFCEGSFTTNWLAQGHSTRVGLEVWFRCVLTGLRIQNAIRRFADTELESTQTAPEREMSAIALWVVELRRRLRVAGVPFGMR